jgi:endonuclease/exonuclease/phosphatase family metal-dependent hydrolase
MSEEPKNRDNFIRYGDEVELLLNVSGADRYLSFKQEFQYSVTEPQPEAASGNDLLKYKWKICPTNQSDLGNPVKANDVVFLESQVSHKYLDAQSGRDDEYFIGDGLTRADESDAQKESVQWRLQQAYPSQSQDLVEGDYLKLQTLWENFDGEYGYLQGETYAQDAKQRVFSFGNGSSDNGCYWNIVKQKTIRSEIEKKYQELGGASGGLGRPLGEEYDVPEGRKRDFENGSILYSLIPAQLSFVVQNMGLLPKKLLDFIPIGNFTYKGTNREQALDTLVQKLRQEPPDVVGLCEVFDKEEQDRIKADLHNVYPHSLDGPHKQNIYYNGGLLLLSKHEIVNNNQIVYSEGSGFDNFTNKGALHARIKASGHPTEYDIFLTHTQDAEASAEASQILRQQLRELANFINQHSDSKTPTLLMGDLNVNGFNAGFYQEMLSLLHKPEDLLAGVITYDENGSFQKDKPNKPIDDPQRHKRGQNLDYFFVWRGSSFHSVYDKTEVVVWQSSPGRDISDHYGLKAQQTEVGAFTVTIK